jgi:rubrerythrin
LVDSLLKFEHLEKNRSVTLGKKILEFSTKMTSVRTTLRTYQREADVNSSETLKVLFSKLPNFGINEWKKGAARINENSCKLNLDDIIKLVKRLASRENHTYSEIQSSKEQG